MSTRLSRLLGTLERFASRPWYPGLIAVVAATDYFIPGSPSNSVLVASVLPRPDRWRAIGIAFAVGCALGAFLLAMLMSTFGEPFVAWIRQSEAAGLWLRLEGIVAAYGLLALAVLAISPFPVRIVVALLALAGTAPVLLSAIVLTGRLAIYPTIAWLAARAPQAVMRLPVIKRFIVLKKSFAAGMPAPGHAHESAAPLEQPDK